MKAAFFILPLLAVLSLAACEDKKTDQTAEETTAVSTPVVEESADAGFTWQGKPIDPICFKDIAGMGETVESVDLASCTGSAGKDEYSVPANGLETFDDGSIGYTFKCADGCMGSPYLAYKYLGQSDGHAVVQITQSGGGTGQFSSLSLVDVKDGKMSIASGLGGGDRCNGGLSDVRVTDGVIHRSQNLTPFDVVDIADGNQADFKAYDDIQACAACCVATANYAGEKLESVTLTLDPKEIVNEDLGPLDACFFGTYNETYFAGKTTLDTAALKTFGQTFNKRCGDLKGKDLPPTIRSGAKPGQID